jgi:hypothetical protein
MPDYVVYHECAYSFPLSYIAVIHTIADILVVLTSKQYMMCVTSVDPYWLGE